jgi:hypothetical protein
VTTADQGGSSRSIGQLLRSFGAFWYDFLIGDDWTVAIGVVIALAVTYAISTAVSAWWVLPLAVIALLALSLRRLARRS